MYMTDPQSTVIGPLRSHLLASIRAALVFFIVLSGAVASAQQAGTDDLWVATWCASPCRILPADAGSVSFEGRTLRQVIHTSVGGSSVRVRISNVDSRARLRVGDAHIALQSEDMAIVPETDRKLTFSGEDSIEIPAGTSVLSDPVELGVPPLSNLTISVYLPGKVGLPTAHVAAMQSSFISKPGDFTDSVKMPATRSIRSWYFITAVEVANDETEGVIVAFGDSITDGDGSSVDANNRWPNFLARRLQKTPDAPKLAVVNAGISGNRVLKPLPGVGISALARFDRDALDVRGVTHIIVLEGINDIGIPHFVEFAKNQVVSAEEIIEGHRQLIDRAHARGLTIIGATLLPYEGAIYYTEEGEVKRQAVNQWIRSGGEYDAVIDFDAAVRNPERPGRIRPEFTRDFLHPNDAGYEAMAESIDLSIFRPSQ